jgi:hypothetical protein
MRTSFVVVWLSSVALVAGIILYVHRQKASPTPAPVAEFAPGKPTARAVEPVVEGPAQTVSHDADGPLEVPVPIPASSEVESEDPIHGDLSAPPPTPFSQAIANLISPQSSFHQKQAAWNQLRDAGQLDQAIEALQQGATENPMSAAYPAALGQAQLYKAGELARNGGTISELGILGMQADQSFDAALKLDPTHWEAQFFKAAAMHHWPLELDRGGEVTSSFSKGSDSIRVGPGIEALLGQHSQAGRRGERTLLCVRVAVQKMGATTVDGIHHVERVQSAKPHRARPFRSSSTAREPRVTLIP